MLRYFDIRSTASPCSPQPKHFQPSAYTCKLGFLSPAWRKHRALSCLFSSSPRRRATVRQSSRFSSLKSTATHHTPARSIASAALWRTQAARSCSVAGMALSARMGLPSRRSRSIIRRTVRPSRPVNFSSSRRGIAFSLPGRRRSAIFACARGMDVVESWLEVVSAREADPVSTARPSAPTLGRVLFSLFILCSPPSASLPTPEARPH